MEHFGTHAEHKKSLENYREPIHEPDEAREHIHELFAQGERPVVSVPEEYAGALSHGLVARATWIPGFEAIVGTFAREPYLPSNEKRVLVKVELDENQIEPRFTGPQKIFEGIVVLRGPIPPEQLVRLN
ncbi:MAG TPA: hypothetical protein VMU25_02140 [Candidatus Paceibacterota bacterium]|nr:hypothetical protein [Candidatus Paceibacterota bacterium]